MRFHWLRLRATAHATEDPERVLSAMRFVAGLDDETFAGVTKDTPVDAHYGGDVRLIESNITRSADIRRGVARLLTAAGDIRSQVEARTDDDGIFYLRFDKQFAYANELKPTKGDDAIHVRIKPEVHPLTREGAIAAMAEAVEMVEKDGEDAKI